MITVYVCHGAHWSQCAAFTARRQARRQAREWRDDGPVTINESSYDGLDDWIAAHASRGGAMVALNNSTPPRIQHAMDRRYGRARVLGDGEVAYWIIR